MPVTLTIKNVPDEVAEQLRLLAASHHRSLQGELMAIIEAITRSHDSGKRQPAFEAAMVAGPGNTNPVSPPSDDLLDQLDAIAIGSRWGRAPILTRSQAHDRALARELDYQVQEERAGYKP